MVEVGEDGEGATAEDYLGVGVLGERGGVEGLGARAERFLQFLVWEL